MTRSHEDEDQLLTGLGSCEVLAHEDLKNGQVVALESYRPVPGAGGDTPNDLRAYALRELEPFIQLAKEGKIRCLVVAAELVDDRASITYPVGQWEPGLIAATQLVQKRLLEQG